MELIKQHESYRMTKEFENGWTAEGTVTYNESEGNLSMWCSIKNELEHIGNLNYSTPKTGNSNINYDVAEANRVTFNECINLLISELLTVITE